jgi:acetyl/propionyl-CoA carboxylase alpha subunit
MPYISYGFLSENAEFAEKQKKTTLSLLGLNRKPYI